ncbi:MAG: alpha-ketoglutarate-dependent dioxygenase AlkB, partial [Porticoccaceae bacterium]|nr:alpha-ketoglutarate-dependent dioxygenase AlkB [Porticoccaceae bacterium]
ERRFQLKRQQGSGRYELALASGAMLVMAGATQKFWQHQVPKEKAVTAPRINITFRRVAGR